MKQSILLILIFTIFNFSTPKAFGQPWVEHGKLVVSENGHFLEHDDGTGFFWLGCTAWMLPRLGPEDVDRYLKDRAGKGFNVIQFTLNNMGRVNFAGEYPILGEGRPWKDMKPNESYWKHVDYIIDRAADYGLYAVLFVWWGGDAHDPRWGEGEDTRQHFIDPERQNYEFGKFLGERYNDLKNIIWVAAGECHKPVSVMFPKNQRPLTESHRKKIFAVIEGIRESEPGTHLYTTHPISFLSSSEDFHNLDWLDFNMIQTHAVAEFIVPLTWRDWNKEPTKPSFNSEGWYENESRLYFRWTGRTPPEGYEINDDWVQRYQAYWSVFAGGFGFTYGHRNLWRMEDEDGNPGVLKEEVLNAPGSRSLIHLKRLMESKPIQSRVPDPFLISSGTTGRDGGLSPDLRIATRDKDGTWAFIYSTWGSLIRLKMHRLAEGKARAFWYNPRTGKWFHKGEESDKKSAFEINIPSGDQAPDHFFDPPGKSGDANDWVLVLEIQD